MSAFINLFINFAFINFSIRKLTENPLHRDSFCCRPGNQISVIFHTINNLIVFMSLIPGSFIFEDIVEAQRFEEYIVKSSIHTHDRRRPTPKGPDL